LKLTISIQLEHTIGRLISLFIENEEFVLQVSTRTRIVNNSVHKHDSELNFIFSDHRQMDARD